MPAKDQWRQSIRPRIEAARELLKKLPIDDLVLASGGRFQEDHLELSLFDTPLAVSIPDFAVTEADGRVCREKTQILLLDYLVRAGRAQTSPPSSEATPVSRRWIGFQELPDGAFYVKAFRSYTSDVLVSGLNGDTDAFRQAVDHFGGEPFSLGDAAASFRALPSICLAVVWWAGDDEFPANASVLFDRAASRALPIDGLAALGSRLCQGLLGVADDETNDEICTMDSEPMLLGKE
ncbi:DUF3786 domain-containing protein [Candidatus Bipolaricaulota bacterium]|jgi:hypothetical protein|nr:DUF3786 domain-containing protein [Candidatus Bipolaricaulota bacterium]